MAKIEIFIEPKDSGSTMDSFPKGRKRRVDGASARYVTFTPSNYKEAEANGVNVNDYRKTLKFWGGARFDHADYRYSVAVYSGEDGPDDNASVFFKVLSSWRFVVDRWRTFRANGLGFSIPKDMPVEDFTPPNRGDVVRWTRFGPWSSEQAGLELKIYRRDAGDLQEWVTRHAESSKSGAPTYFRAVSARVGQTLGRAVTGPDREATQFTWRQTKTRTVHAVAFFFNEYAVTLEWWSDDLSKTGTTLRYTYESLIATYHDCGTGC